MIRILLVDDQPDFVDGMRMILESATDVEVVGHAFDGDEGVRLALELLPDVVLMDIRMPGMDGIRATRAIRRRIPTAPPHVVVLTTIRHDSAVVEAMQFGASGFLMKDSPSELLLSSIRAVVGGHQVIAPAATFDLLRASAPARPMPDDTAIADLTPRERELFTLAAQGRSNAEIATALWLAETTVKTHMRAILAKLGLASRVQLVAFAYEHGLVSAAPTTPAMR